MPFRPRPTRRAKALRNSPTEAERRLWSVLRSRQMQGWKFSRQMPVGPYIVDFMCREARVVIEVDGGQHAIADETERSAFIQAEGWRMLRFWNNDVLGNLEGVAKIIAAACPPQPLPKSGGA